MKKRHVIFDFDGTITDSFGPSSRALLDAARLAGLPFDEKVLATIAENYGAPTSMLLETCWPDQDREIFHQALRDFNKKEQTPLFPGAIEMLETLRRAKIGMSIFTGRKKIGVLPALEHFGIEKYFSPIICREDVETGKPDPEGLFKIIEPLINQGMSKDDILFVGDSWADKECAKNAGLDFVAIAEAENVTPEKFLALGLPKDNILSSLSELPAWLEL